MAGDPAFLFYSKDWVSSTQLMTFEDRGKYIHILSTMHQNGRLDEETIRFLVGNVSVKLKSKFIIDEKGMWYNQRLEDEMEKRANFVDSRRENGKKGGRPKKKEKASGKPLGYPTDNLPVNANVNENINEIKVEMDTPNLKLLQNEIKSMEDKKVTLVFDGVVKMKADDFEKLYNDWEMKDIQAKINSLSTGIHNGLKKYKEYKDHYRTVLNWLSKDCVKKSTFKKPEIAL